MLGCTPDPFLLPRLGEAIPPGEVGLGAHMTRNNNSDTVRLSSTDRTGIFAIAVTILGAVLIAYLAHDRALTGITIRQEFLQIQQEEIREDVERLEVAIQHLHTNTRDN
jgi:hypothetical protein